MDVLHKDKVRPEWIDYNGHFNDGFYVVCFSGGIDALMRHVGIDEAYRTGSKRSIYSLEFHISYLAEAHEGAALNIGCQLLDADEKRMHAYFEMRGEDGTLHAVLESMLLHVDQNGEPKSAPFPPEIDALVQAKLEKDKALPWPDRAGRSIGIKRKA